jgi:hypothetical protein
MQEHVHDERETSQISKVSLRVDERGVVVAVHLAHGMFGGTTGERVEACWERITRGTRTRLSQLVPKFASLWSGRPRNQKWSWGVEWFAVLLKVPIHPVKYTSSEKQECVSGTMVFANDLH